MGAVIAGTFPGTANTQQNDVNGQPLAGALLTVYQGGSSSMLASTYQDIGLTIPSTNPLVADASGRIPLFFVADGNYGIRLTDKNGVQGNGGFFYPSVPSIGASTSGGGGTPVDPTTVFSTGDWKWRPSAEILAGWVRMNGRTIGNAGSGASERANADTQALFIYIWNTYPDAKCAVVGGRGANALADFNASKQITLLDMRGRGPIGLDDMGNAAAGRLTTMNMPGSTDTVTTAAGYGGEARHQLTSAELPANIPYTDPQHTHGISDSGASNWLSFNHSGALTFGSGGHALGDISSLTINSASVNITINPGGGGQHNVMGPFVLGSHYWKL